MEANSLPIYNGEKCALFALGRNAMYATCRMLKLKPGDEVLTPAFDCDGSLQPFRVLDLKLCFFRSDPSNFFVDIDDIKRKITPRTKLIHVINHFGMPQPWDALLSLRKERDIPVLEDNAYSLFSSLSGRPFGTFGDMAIFSLRKNLPLTDGGMLRINNPRYSLLERKKEPPWIYDTEIANLFSIVKKAFGWHKAPRVLRFFAERFISELEPAPPLYSEKEKGFPDWPSRDRVGREFSRDYLRPISRLANAGLCRLSGKDYSEICAKKVEYYNWLAKDLSNIKGIKILWPDLPEGAVPFCLSLLIESKRDLFLRRLRKRFDVMAWPILPRVIIDRLEEFPGVQLLGRKLFQINLSAHNVRLASFPRYLENLVKEFQALSRGVSS